jgi:hypothetical protein
LPPHSKARDQRFVSDGGSHAGTLDNLAEKTSKLTIVITETISVFSVAFPITFGRGFAAPGNSLHF